MANIANAQTGGLNQGIVVPRQSPPVKPPPGTEFKTPEGAKAVANKTGEAKAAALPVKGGTAVAPPNLPPGTEWEAPEGIKATTTKATVGKGTATASTANGKGAAGLLATGKTATAKTVAATGTITTTKGAAIAAAPAGIAVKGATAGGSFWAGSLPASLSLGLGGWVPILIAGTTAAIGIGIYSYLKNKKNNINELEDAIS